MAAKLRKGDKVIVLAGKDKGREGEIVQVMPKDGKAIVSGVNTAIRHTRQSQNNQGGRIPVDMPIDLSNIALVDPKDGGPTRVGFKLDGDKKVRYAKKSGEVLKVREEMPLGVKVTLRGDRMFEFLDRLITIAMPRIRDFRGISAKSFDGRGNYAMGIKEHIVFPEINYDKVDQIWGMDIVMCTTAKTDAEAKALLEKFNMPFPKDAGAK